MTLGELLPSVNAALNLTSGIFLFVGWRNIKAGRKEIHRRFMLLACASSALFLVSYLVRVALTGTHRFPGEGPVKVAYLVLLASHTLLAVAVLPMALRTLFLGWKGRFDAHKRIARFTFPAWLYVSVTGVVVYLMLYHLAPRLP